MFVALLLAVLGPAGSEAPSSAAVPAIEASGSCPSAEEVSATLAPLLGSSAPKRPVEGAARVHDLGDRFEVAAAGQTGQYVDAARDCAERARVAAVFIALALNPPAAPTVPRVDAQPPAEPSGSEDRGFALVGTSGARRPDRAFANGEGRSSPAASLGAELRAVVGKGALGVTVAGGVLAPTVVTFGSVPVRQQRFPFRVAATVRHKMPGPFRARGRSRSLLRSSQAPRRKLDTIDPATRLDVGGRAGLELSLLCAGIELGSLPCSSRGVLSPPLRIRGRPAGSHRIDEATMGGGLGRSFLADRSGAIFGATMKVLPRSTRSSPEGEPGALRSRSLPP